MTRLVVGPFNRVEGDLEVTLDVEAGLVREARVSSPLYRGFEQILQGKAPLDALVIVPRICGICSVAQSAASAQALAAAMGLAMPDNGRLAANLVLACENVADHLTHFYLFFLPDFARPVYAARRWHAMAKARFEAVHGSAASEILPARAGFLRIMGQLAGKWPHTLALQPGGSARAADAADRIRLFVILRELRAFLERTVLGDSLERIAALDSSAALASWAAERPSDSSDLRRFLAIAEDLELESLGCSRAPFLSYGAYAEVGGRWFASGVWDGARGGGGGHGGRHGGSVDRLDVAAISEDTSHAWLAGDDAPRHPAEGATLPIDGKPGAYTWCKAPRLGGRVVEVGALARQAVDGHPLARDLVKRSGGGGSVLSRVVCRLLEVARIVPRMEQWARDLDPGAPFCNHGEMPSEAAGFGLVEAARGSLGHWLTVRRGKLHNYQIVAPTTWNFSPRDASGVPGVLEQALVGTPAGEGDRGVAVQHVVRSFDPCMVCTVH